ncbi:MAG: GDSL-type esterase/lipase family protein [Myxococcota bacterium]
MPRAPSLLSAGLAVLLGLGALAAPLPAQRGPGLQGSPEALATLHAALRDAATRRVRLAFWGASHTAGDEYTGVLRRRLQARFGDGGPGWVLPATPFATGRAGVEVEAHGWRGRFVRGRVGEPRRLDHYGYAGVALRAEGRATARLTLAGTADRVTLHALRQPRGGTLALRAGGMEARLDTQAAASVTLRFPERTPTVSVETDGQGPVRVFGLDFSRGERGITVDALGVPGSRLIDQEKWRPETLRAQLAARPPDLVALAYGTNESVRAREPLSALRDRYRTLLRRWRERVPEAACLLIGPGDFPRERAGRYLPRPRLEQVVRMQAELAAEEGCAFFDTFAFMGGRGAMERWVRRGLALRDHVHFTERGYAAMGDALTNALLAGFTPERDGRLAARD